MKEIMSGLRCSTGVPLLEASFETLDETFALGLTRHLQRMIKKVTELSTRSILNSLPPEYVFAEGLEPLAFFGPLQGILSDSGIDAMISVALFARFDSS